MAGRPPAKDTRYRAAYRAGAQGQTLPHGLAARADEDPALDQMHDAGREGRDYTEALRTHAPHAAPESTEPTTPASSPRNPRPARRLLSGGAAETGAGVLLGAVAYALALSWIRYGAKGPGLWLKAKFLNETTTTGSAPSKKSPGVLA